MAPTAASVSNEEREQGATALGHSAGSRSGFTALGGLNTEGYLP